MTRVLRFVAVAATALGLTGCLVPEKFEASARFQPDGGYTYKYDGSAVHYLAAATIKEKGSLPEKDEASLKREAEKGAKSPGVKQMTYKGEGRYEIHVEQDLKPGQQVRTMKLFNITRDKDGTLVVSAPNLKDKERDQFRSLGIKVGGKVEIFLPGNAKVLEHNASGTPGVLSKAYSWKIGGIDDRPMIRFALTQ